jgi:hypothetical protein
MYSESNGSLLGFLEALPLPAIVQNNGSAGPPGNNQPDVPQPTNQEQPLALPTASPQVARPPEANAVGVSEDSGRDPDERTLTEAAGPAYIYASTTQALHTACNIEGLLKYRERFLAGCGNPQDPVEILLIESLMLAFHNAGRLMVLSAENKSCRAIVAYTAAAGNLLAEIRRGALALQQLRAKSPTTPRAKQEISSGNNGKTSNGQAKRHQSGRTAKKDGQKGKVGSNGNGELPRWIQKRFEFPTPVASLLADEIGCCERV